MWFRLNVVLLIVLLASAFFLVRQSHESRVLFAGVERAKSEARKLDADIQRLRAEREGEATNLRVDQLAREKLQMRPITPALTLQAASAASSAASGGRP
jgi:cell division protein FtsL